MENSNENNIFTNKDEIEYPLESDLVDIKVLNNNTRLLEEKKANILDIETSLIGIAKERTQYVIEDKVKAIETNIRNMSKERTQYVIEDKVKSIENSIRNLARERTQYSIEDSIREISLRGGVKSIQRGYFHPTANDWTYQVNISPIKVNKTIVLLSGNRVERYTNNYTTYGFYLERLTTNYFIVNCGTSSSLNSITGSCSWQVVEFY